MEVCSTLEKAREELNKFVENSLKNDLDGRERLEWSFDEKGEWARNHTSEMSLQIDTYLVLE